MPVLSVRTVKYSHQPVIFLQQPREGQGQLASHHSQLNDCNEHSKQGLGSHKESKHTPSLLSGWLANCPIQRPRDDPAKIAGQELLHFNCLPLERFKKKEMKMHQLLHHSPAGITSWPLEMTLYFSASKLRQKISTGLSLESAENSDTSSVLRGFTEIEDSISA